MIVLEGFHDGPEAMRIISEMGANPGGQLLSAAVREGSIPQEDFEAAWKIRGRLMSAEEVRAATNARSIKEWEETA